MTDAINSAQPSAAETPEFDRLGAETFLDAFHCFLRVLYAAATPHWLDLNITMAQMKALIVLDNEHRHSVGDIAKALGVTGSTASILIDRLVKINLVTRTSDPKDRRRSLIHLTPAGLRLLVQLRQGNQDLLRNATVDLNLDDQEFSDLKDVLERLTAQILQTDSIQNFPTDPEHSC